MLVLPVRITPTGIHPLLSHRRMGQPDYLWTPSRPTPDCTLRACFLVSKSIVFTALDAVSAQPRLHPAHIHQRSQAKPLSSQKIDSFDSAPSQRFAARIDP
jgi:hypothetical protein